MRTFIAIDLDKSIKKNLSLLIDKLDKVSKKIKWVKQQGMHVTLIFLGEIEKGKIKDIQSILKNISKEYRTFSLRLKGTGSFPAGKKNPRVLWVGIAENKILVSLQYRLEEKLEKLGFPKEGRKFHPHLTLGRVKTSSYIGEVLSLLKEQREKNFGKMIVKRITLFQSIIKPSGAEYSVLSEFELK